MKRRSLVWYSLLLLAIFSSFGSAFAAEMSLEDSLKKLDSGTSSIPDLSITQTAPTAPLLPKADQPKIPSTEKVKLAPEEKPPIAGPKEGKGKVEAPKEKQEPSSLEKLLSADDVTKAVEVGDGKPAKTLQQFGYSYFSNVSFAPQLDLPVSPDYLVGPGDTIVVSVWGSIEGSYDLTISRSGEIVLPKIGTIKVAGVQFGKLPDLLKSRLARVFRDFDLAVSMGKLRTIKVFVVGEVQAPGDYTISSLSTVINALSAAGGPTKNGSLRSIKIGRAGKEEFIDLYDFFTRGDKSSDVRLQSGDTIFVPMIGRVAAIAGGVKRPGIYELKQEKTLNDLFSLAEGILPTGYLQHVQISRVVANERKQVIEVNLDLPQGGKNLAELAAGVPIQDMDVVRVFPINSLLRDHFKLEGHLERPGFYALKPGQRLSSVISRESLLPEYSPTVLQITRLFPPDLHPQQITVNLEAAMAHDPANDLEIREFDTIRVFARTELEERPTVKVSGEVQRPGEYPLLKNMTVRDLLIQAGNPKASAYLKSAEVSRLNRAVDRVELQPHVVNLEAVLSGNQEQNMTLEPYDELNVRKIPNWAEEKERYITLSGEFVFPGSYPIYRGERLSSVISRAGGFTDKAFLKGIKFTRESVRKLQQQRMDESLARAQEEVLKKQTAILSAAASKEELDATKATLEGLEKTILLLKGKKAEGRMIVKIDASDRLKGSSYDIEVQGGDNLYVPSDPASVNVMGSVYNPTTSLFEPNQDVSYFLDKVGGITQDGDAGEMYLVKADGTVHSRKQATSFLFFNSFLSKPVDSGDTLIVPQKIEQTAWLRDIKDITTIISQIALSAGTVFLGLR